MRPERGRWRVFLDPLGHDREKFAAAEQSITADVVILAAGALGSTEILLRSREQGLSISDHIGRRFTGNGDVLAFAYNNNVPVNGVGVGDPPQAETDPVGPCITGLIDLRGTPKLEDGMVIEEGSIPSGLAPVLPALMAGGARHFGQDTDKGILDSIEERGRERQSLLFGAYQGAVYRTQTYLVMTHDDAKGRVTLENGGAKLTWPNVAKQPIFKKVEENLKRATTATGGVFTRNPLTDTFLGNNLISVHPLGGCVMGQDKTQGVVNHKCQVFDGRPQAPADAVHAGLYVCDGSVVPRPLGRQPVADDHCARRARHDPSRQGSRLGLHRRADATCPAACGGARGARQAGACGCGVHRAHGGLPLGDGQRAARDRGTARARKRAPR